MKISIIGSGYVGSVTGICLAALKHEIILVDVDTWKVDQLNSGHAPVVEPGRTNYLTKTRIKLKQLPIFGLQFSILISRSSQSAHHQKIMVPSILPM